MYVQWLLSFHVIYACLTSPYRNCWATGSQSCREVGLSNDHVDCVTMALLCAHLWWVECEMRHVWRVEHVTSWPCDKMTMWRVDWWWVDCCKYFSNRVINKWNQLDQSAVGVPASRHLRSVWVKLGKQGWPSSWTRTPQWDFWLGRLHKVSIIWPRHADGVAVSGQAATEFFFCNGSWNVAQTAFT